MTKPTPFALLASLAAVALAAALPLAAAAQGAPAAPAAAPAAAAPAAAAPAAAAPAPAAAPAGDAIAGAQKTQMCAGCHGIEGWRTAFPEVYKVPKIGGQHGPYIVKALQEYKSGERSHPTMRAIAGSLSDKDMADLAAYYSQNGLRTAVK